MTDLAHVVRALLDLRSRDTTACHGCGAVLVTQEDPVTNDDPTPAVWCDRCAAAHPRAGRVDLPQADLIRQIHALTPPGDLCETERFPAYVHAYWSPIFRIARGRCDYTKRQREARKTQGIAGIYSGWKSSEERLAEPIYHAPVECETP